MSLQWLELPEKTLLRCVEVASDSEQLAVAGPLLLLAVMGAFGFEQWASSHSQNLCRFPLSRPVLASPGPRARSQDGLPTRLIFDYEPWEPAKSCKVYCCSHWLCRA